METMRKYMADCEDVKTGELFTFIFESKHRGNTTENKEDAKRWYRKHYGKRDFTVDETFTDKYLYDNRYYA